MVQQRNDNLGQSQSQFGRARQSKGDLAGYKLHARTYGGESDESLCVKHNDTVVTTHKFVTLLDTFLDAF